MSIPGFNAEQSLYMGVASFRESPLNMSAAGRNTVVAQLKSCGSCTQLKWPNGTNTGACARACCTSRPSPGGGPPVVTCSTETCQCPITGILGGFGGLIRF